MEDTNGNTHLFYRMYTFQKGGDPFSDYFENSIYHFVIQHNTDSLFLWDGQDFNYDNHRILDIEFWDSDPSKFIYCGFHAITDPVAIIQRYDQAQPSYSELGEAFNLEIGKQNDSLVIASAPYLIKSTDEGFTWSSFYDSVSILQIISINPFNDNEIFLSYNGFGLLKTIDGGKTLNPVDTSQFNMPVMFYDPDSIHIYLKTRTSLIVSNNRGNAFSWSKQYASSNPIYVSVDYSRSGKLFLADGKGIYVSEDYGTTFHEYKVLDRKIVGLYKKPNSIKLYAATKYHLYEITPDTAIAIKNLTIDPSTFSYYPLQAGNTWLYNYLTCVFDIGPNCTENITIREVTGDTIMANNKKYFTIKEEIYPNNIIYERTDSLEGKIYRYNMADYYDADEYVAVDLLAELGDTFMGSRFSAFQTVYERNDLFNKWGFSADKKIYRELESLFGHTYSLTRNIGLDSVWYEFDFGYSQVTIKGAIINGVVYGDTTILVITNEEVSALNEFYLFQNYPNPFNPTTNFEYQIPNIEFVTLKVFDILGREVTTLVNEQKLPGIYTIQWDASSIASGIYFYSLKAGYYSETKKLLLVK
jgi:hypothetical protein